MLVSNNLELYLIDFDDQLGGILNNSNKVQSINNQTPMDWISETVKQIENSKNIKILNKTRVKIKNITNKAIFAELDSGLVGMLHFKEISFNETNTLECNAQHKNLMRKAYSVTKKLDPTRPVNETSGYQHQKTDIWTVHHYEPIPKLLKKALNPDKGVYRNFPHFETTYKDEPYIIDEYGGVWWLPVKLRKKIKSWGHGDKVRPKSIQEVYERMEKLTEIVLKTKHIQGFCYTQLTDVEQETNGVYLYDRTNKFNLKKLSKIFKDMSLKLKKGYIQ